MEWKASSEPLRNIATRTRSPIIRYFQTKALAEPRPVAPVLIRCLPSFGRARRIRTRIFIYCNAHARRKFKAAKDRFLNEAQFFVDQYKEIYKLEGQVKEKPPDQRDQAIALRAEMLPYFEAMRARAMADTAAYSSKSSIGKAMSYFLKNYTELTRFTQCLDLPIDNNPQERLMRSPVVGRKTWYGTHSKRGALTTAILFSLVESCKLIGVNPRIYFRRLVEDLHAGKHAYTPSEFKAQNPVNAG